jgi:two-component system chemotaxis response regulator CheY
MNILIAEDDQISRKILSMHLSSYGDVTVAENGLEAVEAVSEGLSKGIRFDLICLDIMMPAMDGQEALRKIRRAEANAGLEKEHRSTVIMTTALSDSKHFVAALEDDCDGYLVKPIRKQDLNHMIQQII